MVNVTRDANGNIIKQTPVISSSPSVNNNVASLGTSSFSAAQNIASLGIFNTITLNGSNIIASAAQINYNVVTPGTAAASKTLVLNSSKNITGINNIYTIGNLGINNNNPGKQVEINNSTGQCLRLTYDNSTGLSNLYYSDFTVDSTGNLLISASGSKVSIHSSDNFDIASHNGTTTGLFLAGTLVTASASEINSLTGLNPGTAVAGGLVALDSSKNISGINNIKTIGTLGINTSNPGKQVEINHSSGQCLRLTYNNATGSSNLHYSDFLVSVSGNLTMLASGTTIATDSTNNFNVASHDGSTKGLQLAGTLVTSTATELNYNSGITPGTGTASKALVLNASRNISNINALSCFSLTVNGVAITSGGGGGGGTDYTTGVTPGTASPSLSLVLDASSNITGINILGLTTLKIGSTNVTSTAAEINTLAGVTAGTGSASKALVLDSSRNLTNINSLTVSSLTLGSTALTATATELNRLAGVTAGTAAASKALVLDSSVGVTGLGSISCSSLTVNGVSITTNGGGSSGNISGLITGTVTSGSANAVNNLLLLKNTYSGTATSGIGGTIIIQNQNGAGVMKNSLQIKSYLAIVTNNAEYSSNAFIVRKNGADYTTYTTAGIGGTNVFYSDSQTVLQLMKTPFSADGGSTTGSTGLNEISFTQYNSDGSNGTYARIQCNTTNVSSASGTSQLIFMTKTSGTEQTVLTLNYGSASTLASALNMTGGNLNLGGNSITNTANITLSGYISTNIVPFVNSRSGNFSQTLYAQNTSTQPNLYNFYPISSASSVLTTLDVFGSSNSNPYILSGMVIPANNETYTFYVNVKYTKFRFFIDGKLMLQETSTSNNGTSFVTYTTTLACTAGVPLHIVIHALWFGNSASNIKIEWSSTSVSRTTITGGGTIYSADYRSVEPSPLAGCDLITLYSMPSSSATPVKVEMTVDTSGNMKVLPTGTGVAIGNTTAAHLLELASDSAAKPSTSSWTVSSDSRLKDNIQDADLDICYDNIKNLKLARYTWKDDVYTSEQVPDRTKLGWIAQDVEQVIPKAVTQVEAHGYTDCRTLNVDQIYACMYGAIQKLMQKNEALEARIAALENK